MIRRSRQADRPRALDVVLRLDRQHLAARQPDEDRHRRQADGDHRIGQARAEERGQRDGEDQERAGQQRVGDARDDRRRSSRRNSRRASPNGTPIGDGDGDRDDARHQRGLRAPDHARQDVAPEIVGAEPVQRRRRLADRRASSAAIGIVRSAAAARRCASSDEQQHDQRRRQARAGCAVSLRQPRLRRGGAWAAGCRSGWRRVISVRPQRAG